MDVTKEGQPVTASKAGAGFKVGFCWGLSALGLAARRPLYYLVGLTLFCMTVVAGAMIPYGATIALAAIVSGVACAGSAARAASRVGKSGKSPWVSWFEPFGPSRWRMHLARVVASMAGLLALGFISQPIYTVAYLAADPVAAMSSWPARLGSVVIGYALLGWLVASAAPARGLAGSLRCLSRVCMAPLALLGLGVFWFLFLAVSDAVLSYAIVKALGSDAAAGDLSVRVGLSTLIIFAALLVCAPAMAMSAGLASLDLDPDNEDSQKARLAGGEGIETKVS